MSGALAERDFVEKLGKAGFIDVEVPVRRPWGVDECALYPLFTDELIALMRKLIPLEDQGRVAKSIVVKARLAG
ncbi:MAG: hypothetical protein ACRDKT_03305 [Actinomycetota bacterium]